MLIKHTIRALEVQIKVIFFINIYFSAVEGKLLKKLCTKNLNFLRKQFF